MPQDIGPMEFTNQVIVRLAKRMLKIQKLEKSLWIEAVANEVYTLNQSLIMALRPITPKEM